MFAGSRSVLNTYTHKEIRMCGDAMPIVHYTHSPKINRETRMKISLRRRWVTERWHISRNFNLNSSSPTSLSHFISMNFCCCSANETRWVKEILIGVWLWCPCHEATEHWVCSMECSKLFTYCAKAHRRFKYILKQQNLNVSAIYQILQLNNNQPTLDIFQTRSLHERVNSMASCLSWKQKKN